MDWNFGVLDQEILWLDQEIHSLVKESILIWEHSLMI